MRRIIILVTVILLSSSICNNALANEALNESASRFSNFFIKNTKATISEGKKAYKQNLNESSQACRKIEEQYGTLSQFKWLTKDIPYVIYKFAKKNNIKAQKIVGQLEQITGDDGKFTRVWENYIKRKYSAVPIINTPKSYLCDTKGDQVMIMFNNTAIFLKDNGYPTLSKKLRKTINDILQGKF